MPATLSTDFKAYLPGTVRLSNAVRIVRPDGAVFALTDADWDTTLPALTIGGLTIPETLYTAGLATFPVNHESTADIGTPPNWELVVFADAATLPLSDIEKDKFRGAKYIWLIFSRDDLTWQKIQARGEIAEHDLVGYRVNWKMKGLSHRLQLDAGEVTDTKPRCKWGDAFTEFFDLDGDTDDGFAARVEGAVTAVGDSARRVFTLPDTIGFPEVRFIDGTVTWLTGDNAGQVMSVLHWDNATGEFTLDRDTYEDIAVGDTLTAQIAVPRSIEEWRVYFGTGFGCPCEPEIPTIDSVNAVST